MMLKQLLLLSLVALLFNCNEAEVPGNEISRPNILFLIADDWSYPHAGVYGDPIVRTPTFDRVAAEGALFNNAYCAAPSCSPSRASILTGRYPHQLESAGNLWSVFPKKFPNWVDILTNQGYLSGKTRKGWGPGDFLLGGYAHNPAGKDFGSFKEFYEQKPKKQPFCFWFSSYDPHRAYTPNTGLQAGMSIDQVDVPGFLPDLLCVRNDILDYYFEVERFDRECGQILKILEAAGELDNTIVVMTSDNGMPFPRAKANLYDYGTRMPLAIRWPARITPNLVINDFVNFIDFAPTFLEAAGLEPDPNMSGKSIMSLFNSGQSSSDRNQVFLERERHANVRIGNLSYPMRAVRNHEYLYIRNLIPERWPAGDPDVHQSVGQWGDVDNSITKFLIMNMEHPHEAMGTDFFKLSFAKRPEEELYNVKEDPYQLRNLADDQSYQDILVQLRNKMQNWMAETEDLRALAPKSIYWDTVTYTPNYQRYNFDLMEEIGDYEIVSPYQIAGRTTNRIGCLD